MLPSPQPEHNLGLGFHYFPDDVHYRDIDLKAWLPELTALGAGWLTLRASARRAIPEAFIRGLVEAGIEPIVHLPAQPIAALDLRALESLARTYARWGVHYVVLYDRPNARAVWPAGAFDRAALVERFLDLWLPAVDVMQRHNLPPIFPPLEQGGTYWDTSFLAAALDSLQARGQTAVLEQLALGCYAFAGPHPPDWGAGGPNAWPQSRPYLTPPGSQDQLGFRSFEWYAAVAKQKLGVPRPLLMLAGGARLGETDPVNDSMLDIDWHSSCNMEIASAMFERRLPEYLVNVNFWLLAAADTTAAALAAWYRPDGTTVPVVHELKQVVSVQRARLAATESAARQTEKPLEHYLLLPRYGGAPSEWHWQLVTEYVQRFQPTCGFSPDEARLAQHVTLIGDEQGISRTVEQELRQAGCQVERVTGRDTDNTRARLLAVGERGGTTDGDDFPSQYRNRNKP